MYYNLSLPQKIGVLEGELYEERNIKKELETTVDELRENYNNLIREVPRLEQELKISKENILKMTTMYHKSSAELEKERRQFEERVRSYNERLEEIAVENTELKSSPSPKKNQLKSPCTYN